MKLLITGGAGYIGSHTVQAMLAAGHQVVVYDNLSTGFREAVPQEAEFVQGDVRDRNTLTQTLRTHSVSAVIHFAAKLIVPESVLKPDEYYDCNVGGMLSLVNACSQLKINRIIFSSTAAVFGEGQGKPLKESDPCLPINPYGRSKYFAECMLQDFAKAHSEFKYISLRYFNVAGASGNNGQRTKEATHLIKIASEVAAGKRKQMQIFGQDYATPDGTCVRDYVHVEDLAQAHVVALQALQNGHAGGAFNCGYGKGYSVKEVIATMEKVTGKNLNAQQAPRRAGDPAFLVADASKLTHELSWSPKHNSLSEICQSAYHWESHF